MIIHFYFVQDKIVPRPGGEGWEELEEVPRQQDGLCPGRPSRRRPYLRRQAVSSRRDEVQEPKVLAHRQFLQYVQGRAQVVNQAWCQISVYCNANNAK